MKTISVLDTDITSSNLGNEIIMEAVNDVLNEIFFDDFIIRIQCTDLIGKMSKKYIGLSNFSFIGGSNLLTSEMNVYKQIGFKMLDSFKVNELKGWNKLNSHLLRNYKKITKYNNFVSKIHLIEY